MAVGIEYAEQLVLECDGTHGTDYVEAKSQLSIANSLIEIAKELRLLREEIGKAVNDGE